jgi:hypothetical protein
LISSPSAREDELIQDIVSGLPNFKTNPSQDPSSTSLSGIQERIQALAQAQTRPSQGSQSEPGQGLGPGKSPSPGLASGGGSKRFKTNTGAAARAGLSDYERQKQELETQGGNKAESGGKWLVR